MSTYAKTYALRRVREIALVAEAAPLCMGEIIKVVDGVLGETTELPEWMTLTRAHPEKKSDNLMDEVREVLNSITELGSVRRFGGPAPEDLQELDDALSEAVSLASALLEKMEGK